MQPRKSVHRVYSSSRALREPLKSCSRLDGSTSNGRIDHVFQIWLPPFVPPSLSLPLPRFFSAHLPSPPARGTTIDPKSIHQSLASHEWWWPRHEIFYVTGRARANLSNNKMDSHVSPPSPPPACMLRVNLTSENLIRHGEKNRPISGLQIVGIFFLWDRKK